MGSSVGDILVGQPDSTGEIVEQVYSKSERRFAVYRTRDGVRLQWADDEWLRKEQEDDFARLPPFADIRWLINELRSDGSSKFDALASRLDGLYAEALTEALQGKTQVARESLERVRSEIIEARLMIARRQFFSTAALATCVIVVLATILSNDEVGDWLKAPAALRIFSAAAGTGAIGAFFSLAIRYQQLPASFDEMHRSISTHAISRILVGTIFAMLLMIVLMTGHPAFKPEGGGAFVGPLSGEAAIVSFFAGFIERVEPLLVEMTSPDAELSAIGQTIKDDEKTRASELWSKHVAVLYAQAGKFGIMKIEHAVLGAAALSLYLIMISPTSEALNRIDVLVIVLIVSATAIVVWYYHDAERQTRKLLAKAIEEAKLAIERSDSWPEGRP